MKNPTERIRFCTDEKRTTEKIRFCTDEKKLLKG